jgi:aldose 1-epimerase
MKKVSLLLLVVCLYACKNQPIEAPFLDALAFDTVIDGRKVALYTLTSGGGITMQVTNFGARVVVLAVPDKNGVVEDIVLGHPTIKEYAECVGERFLGPVVGRYANRIAKGQFTLDGENYQLPINNNGQTLHGGLKGLDLVVWAVDSVGANQIRFSYTSPDGDEGFPGTVDIKMVYTLTPENDFEIVYSAVTDRPTILNLSHHGIFNLKGEGNGTIQDHYLKINADGITPIDNLLIPTGAIDSVKATPFDFRHPRTIGERIHRIDDQLRNGGGYDHNWVLNRKSVGDLEQAATLYERVSGRVMEVWTDQPGIQFYSGNFFDGRTIGKQGKAQKYREGLALETQKFPDSPNQPGFPSSRLNPGETYTHKCTYKFRIREDDTFR